MADQQGLGEHRRQNTGRPSGQQGQPGQGARQQTQDKGGKNQDGMNRGADQPRGDPQHR